MTPWTFVNTNTPMSAVDLQLQNKHHPIRIWVSLDMMGLFLMSLVSYYFEFYYATRRVPSGTGYPGYGIVTSILF